MVTRHQEARAAITPEIIATFTCVQEMPDLFSHLKVSGKPAVVPLAGAG